MLPIALQLYSVRDIIEGDFDGTIRKIKELGYDGVEFAGLFGKSPVYIKSLLEENGLTPISAHVPFVDMMANPKKVMNDYAEIGCKYIAIPYLTEEYRPGAEKFGEVIEGARILGRIAKGLGMTLLYHNHDFEFEKIDNKYALDVLYDTVPEELLQTQIDTCWVKVAGESPVEYIRKYTGRVPIVHLKDFMKKGKPMKRYELIGLAGDDNVSEGSDAFFEFRALGQGLQDIPSIISASKAADTQWLVVEQDLPSAGKTSIQCAKESIDYLRNLRRK